MASKRITTTLLRCITTSRVVTPGCTLSHVRLQPSLRAQDQVQDSWGAIRHYSTPAPELKPKVYSFKDIKSLSSNPSPSRVLIDVRELGEFKSGAIPTAINVPIVTVPEAWGLPAEEFEDRFGFSKPEVGKELVFYCKAGIRSSAAAQLALQNGYKKVGNYQGSWVDWEKRTKL